jgi:hypothetical protein
VQDYLGVSKTYYRPTDRGLEGAISEHLAKIRALRAAARESSHGNSHNTTRENTREAAR